jgi:hypothetical protein
MIATVPTTIANTWATETTLKTTQFERIEHLRA